MGSLLSSKRSCTNTGRPGFFRRAFKIGANHAGTQQLLNGDLDAGPEGVVAIVAKPRMPDTVASELGSLRRKQHLAATRAARPPGIEWKGGGHWSVGL
jgi:hypothetical protein